MDDSLDDLYREVAGRDERADVAVPAERRGEVRSLSLAAAYRTWVAPHRERDSAEKGKPAEGTLEKERQAIGRWERWDLEQRPPRWPAGRSWSGLPIGHVTAAYCERWVTDSLEDGALSRATISSTWAHLRVVWNWLADRSRVLDAAPKPEVGGTLDRHADDVEQLAPTRWSLDELDAIHAAIARLDADEVLVRQLLAAFVLSTNCGPRTGDLFGLRWGDDVRIDGAEPELVFRARKTGKRHWCPLPPCVVDHLRVVCDSGQPVGPTGHAVFPDLTAFGKRRPESSRQARRRNALFKQVLRELGYPVDDRRSDHAKPWQIGRRTAYSRVDDQSAGCGEFLCHPPHSAKRRQSSNVKDNYLDWRPRLRQALLAMPQPPRFETFANRRAA